MPFVSFSFQIFYLKKYVLQASFYLSQKSDLLSPSICLKVEQHKMFHLKTQKYLPFSFSSRKNSFFSFFLLTLSDFHNAFCILNSACCQLAVTLEIQRLFFILVVGWILKLILPTVLLLNKTVGQKVKGDNVTWRASWQPGKGCLCLPKPIWLILSTGENLPLCWCERSEKTSSLLTSRGLCLPGTSFSCLSQDASHSWFA